MNIKAYKAFDKDMKCLDFQYEVGKEYDIEDIELCKKGFHACEIPSDVCYYYEFVKSRFAEVELSGKIIKSNNDTKICASHIKIIRELSTYEFIKLCSKWIKEHKTYTTDNTPSGPVNITDDKALIYVPNIKKVNICGNYSKICSSKGFIDIDSVGYNNHIFVSGMSITIQTTGTDINIGSLGNFNSIKCLGSSSYIVSYGLKTDIVIYGLYSTVKSFGEYTTIYSNGYEQSIYSFGDNSKIIVEKEATIESNGNNSTIICGARTRVKAVYGTYIVIQGFKFDKTKGREILYNKVYYVNNKKLKADTWYYIDDSYKINECLINTKEL